MVSGPVGKAEDVDGEDDPDGVKRFYPKIEKGFVKQEWNPILAKRKILIFCYARLICGPASEIPPTPPAKGGRGNFWVCAQSWAEAVQ
jgi:hypothetical protein